MNELDQWLEQARTSPYTSSVAVCMDRSLITEWEEARAELARADETDRPRLQKGVDSLAEKVRAAEVTFVFRSVGHGPWSRLLAQHPPTKDQRKDLDLDHNPETFLPAAMAATCTSPGLTHEQAKQIWETQPDLVVNRLMAAVLEANIIGGDERRVGPVSEGANE